MIDDLIQYVLYAGKWFERSRDSQQILRQTGPARFQYGKYFIKYYNDVLI